MDERLSRIELKLDKIVDSQSDMNVTLGKQQVSLDEHIKRTEMLESELKPIRKHVDRAEGAIKFIGIAAVIFEFVKWLWHL